MYFRLQLLGTYFNSFAANLAHSLFFGGDIAWIVRKFHRVWSKPPNWYLTSKSKDKQWPICRMSELVTKQLKYGPCNCQRWYACQSCLVFNLHWQIERPFFTLIRAVCHTSFFAGMLCVQNSIPHFAVQGLQGESYEVTLSQRRRLECQNEAKWGRPTTSTQAESRSSCKTETGNETHGKESLNHTAMTTFSENAAIWAETTPTTSPKG